MPAQSRDNIKVRSGCCTAWFYLSCIPPFQFICPCFGFQGAVADNAGGIAKVRMNNIHCSLVSPHPQSQPSHHRRLSGCFGITAFRKPVLAVPKPPTHLGLAASRICSITSPGSEGKLPRLRSLIVPLASLKDEAMLAFTAATEDCPGCRDLSVKLESSIARAPAPPGSSSGA